MTADLGDVMLNDPLVLSGFLVQLCDVTLNTGAFGFPVSAV